MKLGSKVRFNYSLQSSPKAGCSSQRDSPKPSSSSQPQCSDLPPTGTCHCQYPGYMSNKGVHVIFHLRFFLSFAGNDYGLGNGFELEETATFLNRLPPTMFGKWI